MRPSYMRSNPLETLAGVCGWLIGLSITVGIVVGPFALVAWILYHFIAKFW